MRSWLLVLGIAAAVAAAVCTPAEAGLAGSSVSVTGWFPSTTNPPPACNPYVDLCGFAQDPYNGGTTSQTVTVPTGTLFEYIATATSSVVNDATIDITSFTTGAFCSDFVSTTTCTDVFDGLVFDFSGNQAITGVTVDTAGSAADFQPASNKLSWTDDAIYVNLVGLNPAEGSELVLDVTTQGVTPVVPEPSTWALMLLGFAGLGWTGWRRGSARAI